MTQLNDIGDVVTRHDMLGMALDYLSPESYLDGIIERSRSHSRGFCCVTNVHQCVLVHDDPVFREKVNAATYVIPDSVILQRARSLRHRVPFISTMRGADIMLALCARAADAGIKVALVGGRDDVVLGELGRRLHARHPRLEIAYSVSPPFRTLSPEEDTAMTEALSASGAALVFVGLGCPKQERWMADHENRIDAIMIGVGAAFDFNAGVVKPSPVWVHKAGLEWLYRLISEPRRLWRRYLTTSPRFIWLLVRDALSGGTETQ